MSSSRVIHAAIVRNIQVAATKFGAATRTGSSAMLSEAVHPLVDGNALLLYGMHRSKTLADADHPPGHRREIYFWSFVVAVSVLSLGACASRYEGVIDVLDPVPVAHASVAYEVLAV